MPDESRQRWFAEMVRAALEEKLLEPPQVLEHVTPEVLAKNLPAELLGEVLSSALSASAMTPDGVLGTLPPDQLARHVPHEVLWACVSAAAERAKLSEPDEG